MSKISKNKIVWLFLVFLVLFPFITYLSRKRFGRAQPSGESPENPKKSNEDTKSRTSSKPTNITQEEEVNVPLTDSEIEDANKRKIDRDKEELEESDLESSNEHNESGSGKSKQEPFNNNYFKESNVHTSEVNTETGDNTTTDNTSGPTYIKDSKKVQRKTKRTKKKSTATKKDTSANNLSDNSDVANEDSSSLHSKKKAKASTEKANPPKRKSFKKKEGQTKKDRLNDTNELSSEDLGYVPEDEDIFDDSVAEASDENSTYFHGKGPNVKEDRTTRPPINIELEENIVGRVSGICQNIWEFMENEENKATYAYLKNQKMDNNSARIDLLEDIEEGCVTANTDNATKEEATSIDKIFESLRKKHIDGTIGDVYFEFAKNILNHKKNLIPRMKELIRIYNSMEAEDFFSCVFQSFSDRLPVFTGGKQNSELVAHCFMQFMYQLIDKRLSFDFFDNYQRFLVRDDFDLSNPQELRRNLKENLYINVLVSLRRNIENSTMEEVNILNNPKELLRELSNASRCSQGGATTDVSDYDLNLFD